MGASGTDILLSERALQVLPFAIECKCQEKLNLWEAWSQTIMNVEKPNQYPLLIIKRNHSIPLAVVDAELFMKIVAGAVTNG